MLYKVSELAEELDIPQRTLYDWLDHGVPHQRDNRGHIWINGQEFASWVYSVRNKNVEKLQDNEGYCFRCKSRVEMFGAKVIQEPGKPKRVQGTCSICQGAIAKGVPSYGQ